MYYENENNNECRYERLALVLYSAVLEEMSRKCREELVLSRINVENGSLQLAWCRADIVLMSCKLVCKLGASRTSLIYGEKRQQLKTFTRCLYEFVRHPFDIPSTCLRDKKSHDNFKPFKILAASCRVLATLGDISTTCEDNCTSFTRHMTRCGEL